MPEELVCVQPLERRGLILIEPDVLAHINHYRQDSASKAEAGGIILGYRRGTHLHIVEVTSPQPLDIRSRYSFHRQDAEHQRIALDRWNRSNGIIDYLGEWHTHPEEPPVPSPIDHSEWRKLCIVNPAPLVFLIAGTQVSYWIGLGWKPSAKCPPIVMPAMPRH